MANVWFPVTWNFLYFSELSAGFTLKEFSHTPSLESIVTFTLPVNLGFTRVNPKDELKSNSFSNTGNFGFGINEHIDLGIKYDPSTGIYGMDFYVVLSRFGERINQRKRCKRKMGKLQKVNKEDAIKWFLEKYEGTLI